MNGFVEELLKIAGGHWDGKPIIKGPWRHNEVKELHKIYSKLPPFIANNNRKVAFIVRARKLIGGPPDAPGHSMYKPSNGGMIVIFDKGIYDSEHKLDPVLFGKSVLHELSHTIDGKIPDVFGRPPYITDYASRSKKEDWAESFAEYFLHPEILKQKAPQKHRAIKTFIGERNAKR